MKTSTILVQELRRWVCKILVGIGFYFLRVGNTSFHSTVQLHVTSLAPVEGTLTFQNLGQTDKQMDGQTAVFVELLSN